MAAAMLMQSVDQVSRSMTCSLSQEESHQVHSQQLANASVLSNAVPAFTLHLSLTGWFWVEMERAQTGLDEHEPLPPSSAPPISAGSFFKEALPIVLTGSSMNPFFHSGDLLEVEPLSSEISYGDVIYFCSPEDGRMVVHRVVEITAAGVQTRGDNNPADDPSPVPLDAIVGRIVAAHRSQRRFVVPGGRQGMVMAVLARFRRQMRSALASVFGSAYRGLARAVLVSRLLPEPLKPRIVAFGTSFHQQYKLISGRREIEHYDERCRRWRIQLPFRLIVNEVQLERAAALAEETRARAKAQVAERLRMRAGCA